MNFDEELRKLKRAEKYRNVGLWLLAGGFFLLSISVLANSLASVLGKLFNFQSPLK